MVEFVTLFNRLSPDQQKMIIAQIKGILSDET
nr:MAG TPA: bacteriocin [Caudoviricetes sp.]